MSYIHKMVGPDEHLVGIARPHWIYLTKGLIGFGLCQAMAWVLNIGIYYAITALSLPTAAPAFLAPMTQMNHYFGLLMLGAGALIFSFYLFKFLGTEVGLTTRRLIVKRGLIITTTHEADIEEIRGERMDLGWFGRIFNYGSIQLDCRFIEDLKTPIIGKPERFVRALHKMRSESTDSVGSIAAHPYNSDEPAPHPAPLAIEHELTTAEKVAALDPSVVAEIVHQATPHIVEEVMEQMAEKKALESPAPSKPERHHGELEETFDDVAADTPKKPSAAH